MKCVNYKKRFDLFLVSLFLFSLGSILAVRELRVPLLNLEEQHGDNQNLSKNQRKLMSKIRDGEDIAWISVKVGNTDFEDAYGNTPLMVASAYDNTGALQGLLLFNSGSINKQNDEGNTALMLAAMYGHSRAVAMLLEYFNIVDVDMVNNEGKTAIDLAREGGFDRIVRLIELLKDRKSKF